VTAGRPDHPSADRRVFRSGRRTFELAGRSAGGAPPEEEFGQGLAGVLRGVRAMLAEPSP
jgi:hypothetical protein